MGSERLSGVIPSGLIISLMAPDDVTETAVPIRIESISLSFPTLFSEGSLERDYSFSPFLSHNSSDRDDR